MHHATLGYADKIVEAVKTGKIRHLYKNPFGKAISDKNLNVLTCAHFTFTNKSYIIRVSVG